MFCTQCGNRVLEKDRFCAQCGAAQTAIAVPVAARRLYRPRAGRKLGGVSLGFAYYMDVDVTMIRILLVVLTLLTGGAMLIAYLVAWIIMPEEVYVLPGTNTPAVVTPTEPPVRA